MKTSPFEVVRNALGTLYKGGKTDDEITALLATQLTREELAAFIVDARQRGWISLGNLGLNDDGDPI